MLHTCTDAELFPPRYHIPGPSPTRRSQRLQQQPQKVIHPRSSRGLRGQARGIQPFVVVQRDNRRGNRPRGVSTYLSVQLSKKRVSLSSLNHSLFYSGRLDNRVATWRHKDCACYCCQRWLQPAAIREGGVFGIIETWVPTCIPNLLHDVFASGLRFTRSPFKLGSILGQVWGG